MQSFAHKGFWAGTLRGLFFTSPQTHLSAVLPSPVSPSVCLSGKSYRAAIDGRERGIGGPSRPLLSAAGSRSPKE